MSPCAGTLTALNVCMKFSNHCHFIPFEIIPVCFRGSIFRVPRKFSWNIINEDSKVSESFVIVDTAILFLFAMDCINL